MTAFKNRNGNTSPALHNQADLSQRRRGRAATQQAAAASPVQSPAAPALNPAITDAPAPTRRRRQQTAPAAAATPVAQTVPVQAAAVQQRAPAQNPAPASARQIVGTDAAPAKSLRRRQQPQTPDATMASQPEVQPTAKPSPATSPAITPATRNMVVNQTAIPATDQADQIARRTERRQIRVAAPNMTWKSLTDVPKPDGPLNAQMLQVARLIEVGIELAGMVEDENLQMAQGQVRMLSDHQAHKSELSSAYIQTMNSLRAHPPALKEGNLPMIQFMKEVAARVQTALDTHMSMCRAAMSMTEQLIGKIRKDVAAHDGQELQYKNPLLGGRARRATQERVSAVAHNTLV